MTQSYFKPKTIYCGDCLEVLRQFPEDSVDLIYADPPFFSNRRFEIIWNDGFEKRSFEDRWKGGINNYVVWMGERLAECFRILKPSGTMFLHCDHHAVHYLKVEMDRLFGENNFVNEIIWQRQFAKHSDAKQKSKHFGRIHDTILFYSKSKDYVWNTQYHPFSEEYINTAYKKVELETGRRYQLTAIDGPGGAAKGNPRYEFLGVTRYWRYSKKNMKKLYEQGRIVQTKPGNVPRYKTYLDEMKGVELQDLWIDIKPVTTGKESLGYPTQKPVLLLERIIKSASNPKDLVLDPFCGCGTAIAAAHKLGREWIGIDVSPTACTLMSKRMRLSIARGFAVVGMPMTEKELRKLEPFEFQNWVVQRLFGRVSQKKSADMGIDGYTFEGYPIQVKQSESIGRNVVDNFETAMRRTKSKVGVIIAISFGKGAHEEIARAKRDENLEIKAITVSELVKKERQSLL